jgi:DNA-binding transcriptional regulator YdaS (Cro superfamily)
MKNCEKTSSMIRYATYVKLENILSMDLEKYLESRNLGKKEFATMIGVSAATISNYIHFRRKPTLDIANRIMKATKGKVTIEDLLAYWEAKKDHG